MTTFMATNMTELKNMIEAYEGEATEIRIKPFKTSFMVTVFREGDTILMENVANDLLDFYVEAYGAVEACVFLLRSGYSDEELRKLGFDDETSLAAKESVSND